MGLFNDLTEKIKKSLSRQKTFSNSEESPRIEIIRRVNQSSDPAPPVTPLNVPNDNSRITIGEIHTRSSVITGSQVSQAQVPKQNLGHGITVNQQRMPNRCPLCATKGRVIQNTDGGDKWKCTECGSTFN